MLAPSARHLALALTRFVGADTHERGTQRPRLQRSVNANGLAVQRIFEEKPMNVSLRRELSALDRSVPSSTASPLESDRRFYCTARTLMQYDFDRLTVPWQRIC
jgi:hypothetical protein